MVADLITLEEFKYAMADSQTESTQATEEEDEKFRKAISASSEAVRKYCDRRFGEPVSTADKVYDYDSSGFLDIDDAQKVNSVKFIFPAAFEFPIDTIYWRAEPQEGPPYEYIRIPKWAGVYSPQMGFRENLDRIANERGWPGLPPQVKINAEWGWPEVPQDVRQATIWTAAKFQEKPDQLVSESIANYAYTTQNRATIGPPPAIPPQAQDLLNPYVRFLV